MICRYIRSSFVLVFNEPAGRVPFPRLNRYKSVAGISV